jgi:hypothetical protein
LLGIAPDADTHEAHAGSGPAGSHLAYLAASIARPDNVPAVWQTVQEQLRRAGEPPSSVWDVPRMAA